MKTVIEMAREAGMNLTPAQFSGVLEDEIDEFQIERFAELVRADERESICKFMEHDVDLSGISEAPQLQNYTTTLLKTLSDCIRARGETA